MTKIAHEVDALLAAGKSTRRKASSRSDRKGDIENRAISGLSLDGKAVASLSRDRGTMHLRHVWPDDTDARVWHGVRSAFINWAQEVANATHKPVEVYAKGGVDAGTSTPGGLIVIWLGLSALVAPLRPLVAAAPDLPLRERAAWVGAQQYGWALLASEPSIINIAALAILSRGSPPIYQCRPSASRVVHETDLHAIPGEPPPLLCTPGIIEARRPETGERLWGDVAALGWYPLPAGNSGNETLLDTVMLVGLSYPDGAIVARWRPAWTGEDLSEQLPYPDVQSSLIETLDLAAHTEFARRAARYLIVFGLLEQIDHGPLRFDLERGSKIRAVRTRERKAAQWPLLPPRAQPLPDGTGKALGDTLVRGHLRRVRCGPGGVERKWRYVEQHGARRWMAARWTVERDHSHIGLANATLVYRP